jgi:hypothetical protein
MIDKAREPWKKTLRNVHLHNGSSSPFKMKKPNSKHKIANTEARRPYDAILTYIPTNAPKGKTYTTTHIVSHEITKAAKTEYNINGRAQR